MLKKNKIKRYLYLYIYFIKCFYYQLFNVLFNKVIIIDLNVHLLSILICFFTKYNFRYNAILCVNKTLNDFFSLTRYRYTIIFRIETNEQIIMVDE